VENLKNVNYLVVEFDKKQEKLEAEFQSSKKQQQTLPPVVVKQEHM